MEGQNNLPGNVRRPHLKDKNFPGKLTQQREFSAERPLYAKKKKTHTKQKQTKKTGSYVALAYLVICCPFLHSLFTDIYCAPMDQTLC